MLAAGVTLRPSISLINIQKVSFLAKFKSRHFFTSNTPRGKITISNGIISNITSDKNAGTYRLYNTERGEKILATAGHRSYLVFDGSSSNFPRRCDYCKCDYNGENYGVPIKKETHIVSHDGVTNPVYVFFTDGNCCCEEHAFGCIDMYQKYYANREELRKIFYEKYMLQYQGRDFLPPNPPELHEREGGSLVDEEWKNGRYIYAKHSVICIPIKTEYLRQINSCTFNATGNSSSTL